MSLPAPLRHAPQRTFFHFGPIRTAAISRAVKIGEQGSMTFYSMMIPAGFNAMAWAAGAIGVYSLGPQPADANPAVSATGCGPQGSSRKTRAASSPPRPIWASLSGMAESAPAF